MKVTDKYVFFWNGIFSNWYPSKFEVDGLNFNCGEQYMMYSKAMLFGDMEAAEKIMASHNPKTQKAIGRKVKNYDNHKWESVRKQIVKRGLREKFRQNFYLKKQLLKYKGKIYCEASPYDKIWGIGYGESEALKFEDNWGKNLLGEILTELSNEL